MTTAEVTQAVADLAITGKLEVDNPHSEFIDCLTCGHRYHNHYRTELRGKGCALCGCRRYEWREARHLIPVVSLPKCATCSGRGNFDFGDAVMACPDCTDGYPIGQRITLTTKYSLGRQPAGFTGHRRKATGTLRAALPICSGVDDFAEKHMRSMLTYKPLSKVPLVLHLGRDDIDVSHLSALCDWTPGGWAVLLTDLSPA